MHELPGIAEAAHEHYRQALHRLGSLPEALSVERFIATVRQTGPVTDYKYYSPTARAMVADLSSIVGAGGARRFLKAAISGALADSIASEAFRQLPERVRSQQTAQFLRMALDPDLEADWLDIDSDLFHKEMGMATLRLYVAGAQLVDYLCGVPRSIILKEGRARAPQKLMAFVRDGGFKPFFRFIPIPST